MKKEFDHDEFYHDLLYGIHLYRAKRSEEAIKHFLKMLVQYPDSSEIHYNLAIIYIETDNFSTATHHLMQINADKVHDSFQAEICFLLGVCHIRLHNLEDAFHSFQKAVNIHPHLRTKELLYLKKYLLKIKTPSPKLYEELGDCYLSLGSDFNAEEMYLKALESGGSHPTLIQSFSKVNERIHNMKKRITTVHSTPSFSDAAPLTAHKSLTWFQSASYPPTDLKKINKGRDKLWDDYFLNGNTVLEMKLDHVTVPDTVEFKAEYDGVIVSIRENFISPSTLLKLIKQCLGLVNETGKIIISIQPKINPPEIKNMLITFLNSGGWTVKESNERDDENTFFIVAQQTKYDIIWQSVFFNSSGYAEEQNHFLDAVRPYPLRIKINAIDSVPPIDQYPANMKNYLLSVQNQKVNCPIIHYQAAPADAFSMPSAPISIGRTMFETDSVPSSWVNILNELTEIWVPSEFNRNTFASAGVKLEKIKVLPEPLDEQKYNPINIVPYPLKTANSYKFLSVFDWSPRKGWEILIRAYFEEFNEEDDVSLILKVSKINEPNTNPHLKIQEIAKKLNKRKLPHVHIIQETLSQKNMIGLYSLADCFVLPSRGEGWGRPYMEAMAMELPTIGTRWSGQQAFMNDDNSYLINIDRLIPVDSSGLPPHFHGHKWANPDLDHLKSLMRYVFDHPKEAKQKGLAARKSLFPKFSKAAIGQQIYQMMEELIMSYYK